MSATILYQHPDGYTIGYTIGYTDSHLIVVDDNGLEVHIPIGPQGLIELGWQMTALGTTTEALAAAQLAASKSVGGAY